MTATVLTIGTTHPLAIAGLGLDLRVAAALEVRPFAIVAGISAQSAHAVRLATPVATAVIGQQFAALAEIRVDATRIGALVGAESVAAVVGGIGGRGGPGPLVWDPVIAASTGERLADDATVAAIRAGIAALAPIVTPNLAEAAELLRIPVPTDVRAMADAARALVARGASAALLKGGHLAGDAVDVLADAHEIVEFRSVRRAQSLRGTGDLLAFALAAALARGRELRAAVEAARAFVIERIASGEDVGGTRAT